LRKGLLALLALVAAGAIAFYLLTIPVTVPASALPDHAPDVANGKYMFIAGGCAECHAVPEGACDDLDIKDETVLAGGRCFKTDFGTFHVPNISPDKETGIGKWTTLDFINAMKRGIAPGGVHLYPAFPYTSYQHMTYEDLIDIAYLLETGNTPDFDTVGDAMVPVQENMARLTPEDRDAIAAFVKSLPPHPNAVEKSKTTSGDGDTQDERPPFIRGSLGPLRGD
jgi:mono/diheme cytochrome c family protein